MTVRQLKYGIAYSVDPNEMKVAVNEFGFDTAEEAAERLISLGDWLSTDLKRYLPCAVRASRAGVGRVHLIVMAKFISTAQQGVFDGFMQGSRFFFEKLAKCAL